MILNFDNIEVQKLEGFKGGEGHLEARIFDEENNRVVMGKLQPGHSIGLHRHEGNSEFIYILEGNGSVEFEGEMLELKAGDLHFCPEGCEHRLINTSDAEMRFFGIIPTHNK